MKVSVIVPVYNVENYIAKCLDSLVNQTLKDIEIIVINDGSPDNSEEIIKKAQEKYKNIIYLKKENGGVSSARNYGLKKATGEYIYFLDGDDYLLNDALENFYNKAKSGDFDMVIAPVTYILEDKEFDVPTGISKDLIGKEEVKENLVYLYPADGSKLYKRGVWFEYVEFNFRLYPKLKNIGNLSKSYLKYIRRDNAITSTFDKRLFDYIDNFNGLVDYYKKNNYYNTYYNELEYSYVRYLYATFIKQLSLSHDFPNYKKNIYLKKFSFKNFYLKHFNKLFANLLYIIHSR